MPAYNLLIATPDAILYEGEVKSVIFNGVEGNFEVLANHAPLITMTKKGVVEITDSNGNKNSVETGEGFFEFDKNKGVLLTQAVSVS